jgi:predicted Zn-dependent protease
VTVDTNQTDINNLNAALAYLQQNSPAASAILQAWVASNPNPTILISTTDAAGQNPSTGKTVPVWDPTLQANVLSNSGAIEGQNSAALDLLHEIVHALDPNFPTDGDAAAEYPSTSPLAPYVNPAEYYAVTVTDIAAAQLGELNRTNESGSVASYNSPVTQHTSVPVNGTYPANITNISEINGQPVFVLPAGQASTIQGTGNWVGVSSGAQTSISTSQNTFVIPQGANAAITGGNNTLAMGNGSAATVSGTSNVAYCGSNDVTGITGTESLSCTSTNLSLTGSNSTFTVAANSNVTVSGTANNVTLDNGSTATISSSGNNTFTCGTAQATVTGNATLSCSGNALGISGNDGTVSVSNDTVNVAANSSVTIDSKGGDTINVANGAVLNLNATTLNDDVINVPAGATVTISGGYDDIINAAAGSTVKYTGDDSDNILASGATIDVMANSEISVWDATAGKGNNVNFSTGDAGGIYGGGNAVNVVAKDNVIFDGTNGTPDSITAVGDDGTGPAVNGARALMEFYSAQANIYGSSSWVYEMPAVTSGQPSDTLNVYGNSDYAVGYSSTSTNDVTTTYGTGDDNYMQGTGDKTTNNGNNTLTADAGNNENSYDDGSQEKSFQTGKSDVGYDANDYDTNYVANSTDTTTGAAGTGYTGTLPSGYDGDPDPDPGFAGPASTVAAAVGSNIFSIAQADLAAGNKQGAAEAQAALQQVQSAIASGATSVLTGATWDQKIITWSIAGQGGQFSDNMSKAEQAAVAQAFSSWASASGLTFEEVSNPSQADITVGLSDLGTATTGLVGYTTSNSTAGIMRSAVVQVEDGAQDSLVAGANDQLTYSGTQATFEQDLIHEIGHALGLADNASATSIEGYYLTSQNQTISQADVTAIQELYNAFKAPTIPASVSQLIQSIAGLGGTSAAQISPGIEMLPKGQSQLQLAVAH